MTAWRTFAPTKKSAINAWAALRFKASINGGERVAFFIIISAIIKIIVVPSLTGGSFAPEETLSDGDALWEFSIDFPFEGAGYKAISFRDDHDNMVSGSIYIDRPADSEVEARFDLEMPDGKRLTGNYRGPFKPLSAVE